MKQLALIFVLIFGGMAAVGPATASDHVAPQTFSESIIPIPPSISEKAPARGAAWSCKNWGFSPDGHRAGVLCSGGPPEKYKIKAHFCNADQSRCWWKSGKATRYTKRARVYSEFGYTWSGEGATVYAVAPV